MRGTTVFSPLPLGEGLGVRDGATSSDIAGMTACPHPHPSPASGRGERSIPARRFLLSSPIPACYSSITSLHPPAAREQHAIMRLPVSRSARVSTTSR